MAKLTQQDKEDIVRRVAKGVSIAVLAEDFKVSEPTIRKAIKAAPKQGVKSSPDQALGEAMDEHFTSKSYTLKSAGQHAEGLFKNTMHPVNRLSIKLDTATLAERMTSKMARDNFRLAAKNLSQAMLRDELTEALNEFFPEKPL